MIDTNFTATREQIIERYPLLEYVEARGWKLRREAGRFRCLCPLHKEKTPSFVISNNLWKCFGCGEGGSVIDLHAKLHGFSIGQAMADLWPSADYEKGRQEFSTRMREARVNTTSEDDYDPFAPRGTNGNGRVGQEVEVSPGGEVAAYDYEDASGRVVYQVVRFEPKDFRQCRLLDGERVWSMEGVERMPYRLPEILARPHSTWIVEGEKDVEALREIGQAATCNPGGAGKWLPAFSQYLKDQCIYLCPDRDEPGLKHGKMVLKSLENICKWVRWVELPPEHQGKPVKDVADLRAACASAEEFIDQLYGLQQRSRLLERGLESDGYTIAELQAAYIAESRSFGEGSLSISSWIPTLQVRSLGAGDVLGILAATGQSKSAFVLNLLAANPELPSLFFQLELSSGAMFERVMAISLGMVADKVAKNHQCGEVMSLEAAQAKFRRMITYTKPMTILQIDEEIARSTAKLGCLPKVFVIDYIQLVAGSGSRYERTSNACEMARLLAKKWHAVAVLVSQIGRKKSEFSDDEAIREVGLYDAKESGSFENSCSLVLGLWKTSESELSCKVLKNSRGIGGGIAKLSLRGGTYIIEPAA